MSSQTLTRDQALQRAVQLWKKGSQAESKRLLYEVLKQAPQDVQSRALLRSAVSNQVRGGTADFSNRFEQAFMSDPDSFLHNAARGWLYSLTLDQAFVDPSLERRSLPPKRKPKSTPVRQAGRGSADEILSSLLLMENLKERWQAVLDLTHSNERVVVEDSFASVDDAELHDQLAKSLRHDGLNIVVIGGGIMGLALANALKIFALSPRIQSFLQLIADSGSLSKIIIEPPFFYSPYIRYMSGTLSRLYGRPLVPIGDSMFIGHPKVGNGLGVHLQLVPTIHDLALLMYGH